MTTSTLPEPGHGGEALQGFIDKWLAVQPIQRQALVFVPGERYPGHVALAALEQEWLATAYGIREPQVALAKLNWWAEEMAGAGQTGGHHPLTRVLFDDERAHAMPTGTWLAPLQAAAEQLEQGTAADFAEQVQAATPLHGSLATLETRWWYGAEASPERAARLAVLNHLLDALLHLPADAERDRLPLPMARLARHGLSRADLAHDGEGRRQALREQLLEWLDLARQAEAVPGPLSVFRALESARISRLVRQAAKAENPLAALHAGLPATGFGVTWRAWRAARQWQRRLAG